jgi:hypothetical protein
MRSVALIDRKVIMKLAARVVELSKRNGNSPRTNSELKG